MNLILKKTICMVLSLVSFFLLCACGLKEAEPAPAPEASETPTVETTPAPDPPVMRLRPFACLVGEDPRAEDAVSDYEGTGTVEFEFKTVPDTSETGEYPVTVIATDETGQSVSAGTTLIVADLIVNAPLEAKRQDVTKLIMSADFETFGRTSYENPNWELEHLGANPVYMVFGTWERYLVAVIAEDTVPPVIHLPSKNYYVGDSIAYMKGLKVWDNADTDVEVTVDPGDLDPHKAGIYPVVYTATDDDGNTTELTVEFTFSEITVTEEQVREKCDEIFSRILTDDMSMGEKAYEIYKFCRNEITYGGGSDKTNYLAEAYRGMTEGYGDCFTFYSAATFMLREIGAEVIRVERHDEEFTTPHYWCLVNLGTGWYHLDPCNAGPDSIPVIARDMNGDPIVSEDGTPRLYIPGAFMVTTDYLRGISVGYWNFDEEFYPEVSSTPYSGTED